MNHIFQEPKTVGKFEKYEPMIEDIRRESEKLAWASGYSTVFYLMLIAALATVAACVFSLLTSFAWMAIIFFVEFLLIFTPFLLSLQKANELTRERCAELESEHPGIYEVYEEWQRRRDIDSGSN